LPDLPANEQVQTYVPCTAFTSPEECTIVVYSASHVPVKLPWTVPVAVFVGMVLPSAVRTTSALALVIVSVPLTVEGGVAAALTVSMVATRP
jgi:hypothetical protein